MVCWGLSLCPCSCYSVLPWGGECDCWDITEHLHQGSLQQHSALTLTALGLTPYPRILSHPMCLGPHLSGSYIQNMVAIKWTLCRVLKSCRHKRQQANPREIYTILANCKQWCMMNVVILVSLIMSTTSVGRCIKRAWSWLNTGTKKGQFCLQYVHHKCCCLVSE